MKTILQSIVGLFFLSTAIAQNTLSPSNFEYLNASSWSGNLMYINYSDGKEVNIRTTLKIFLKDDTIIQEMEFPDEPKANYVSRIRIKKNGTYFGNEKVEALDFTEGKITNLTTSYQGRDNNKKANIYKTYMFGEQNLSITKTVVFQKSGKKLIRNRYTYNRQ
ncbi:hypothetical protein [Ulvibacterium sp.]|uniref:hypothetical protein n=1 Tax=Ulvibacterium sp. TaxID=2665914 RepID=UPI00260E96B9|nr:hypothetical protein [Ulvibacterium sp.]